MTIKRYLFTFLKMVSKLLPFPIRYKHIISLFIKRMFYSDEEIAKLSGCNSIDKRSLEQKINTIGDLQGVSTQKRNPELIVSLTSYPERMKDLKFTLYSLLKQTIKPDKIILWLSYEEFPNKEHDVEEDILRFKKNGLEIKFCKNLKSYNKLVPLLREYPNCIAVTTDDDVYYPVDFLEILYNSYLEQPDIIHCHRAHKLSFSKTGKLLAYNSWESCVSGDVTFPSFLNFFTGVGGVLYPPGSLYKDILNENLFIKLCPTADDIWFWVMAVMQKTKINVVMNNISALICIDAAQAIGLKGKSLSQINVAQCKNDEQLKAVFKYYNLYEKIRDDLNNT